MRIGRLLAVSVMVLLVGGCVPSLYPLYDSTTKLTADSRLNGIWTDDGCNETWEFHPADGNTYELLYAKDESAAHFAACIVDLDGKLFIDTYPDESMDNDLLELHLVPAHIFGRIWLSDDTLMLSMLDGSWLDSMIVNGHLKIAHEKLAEGTILTAKPSQLQKLARQYADDPNAFTEPEKLHRLF